MDSSLDQAVRDFLASPRITVAGVSRDPQKVANAVYRKLRDAGTKVTATNPHTPTAEGDPCYPDLRSIPGGTDAVFIATRPEHVGAIVRECLDLGVRRVWMHRAIGAGSVDREAVRTCRENGITVIAGACPMMYLAPVDVAHRCLRVVLGWLGRMPRMG